MVVVGAGAGGALSAVHLLRAAPAGGVEVVLVDAGGEFGPGVAYRTEDPMHLLNVAAVRMGGIAENPADFFEWLQRRGGDPDPAAFVSRGVFGEYLRELLDTTEREAAAGSELTRRRGEVVAVAEAEGAAGPLEVRLADGCRIEADRVVLALGHLPGGDPIPVPEQLRAAGVYVPDPWAPGALDAAHGDGSVLVIGTGLTTVDVSLSLAGRDDGPEVLAVSRNGLTPRRHREDLTTVEQFPVPVGGGDLDPVIAAVVERIERVSERGGDWRDVFDSMRTPTPAIWRGLRVEEKRRFLTTMMRFWDVHRFRMAPLVADRFAALQERGRVSVQAASIAAIEAHGAGARVLLRTGADGDSHPVDVDRVINCTGAGVDLLRTAPPLVAGLIESGMARPDDLGLGLDVDPHGALVDAGGRPNARIDVIGGLRKGVEWEAIGVTEIRDHAAAAARRTFSAAGEELETAL